MKIFFAILSLLICLCEAYAQDYSCKELKSGEKTRQNYSAIVNVREKESFQIVRGIAKLQDVPTENVFVEVFADKNPNRIAGCKTGGNGRFSFPNLKKGNYTLRLSKDGGFMVTDIKIRVSPKSKNRKEMIGVIELGV